jgi:hypothetical protein
LVLLDETRVRDGANAFAVARSTTRARYKVPERPFMVVAVNYSLLYRGNDEPEEQWELLTRKKKLIFFVYNLVQILRGRRLSCAHAMKNRRQNTVEQND